MGLVLLIPHVDAGDRTVWTGDHDVRPLSELGRRQADALADALANREIVATYASPAMRAQQTLEPLAKRLGLAVTVDSGVAEKQLGEDGAGMARRGWATLRGFSEGARGETIVAASHGDLIPALADYLAAEYQLGGVSDITRRGQWYEIQIVGGVAVSMRLNEGPEDFPLV